jgi:transforming growth factor-beta-induced protein
MKRISRGLLFAVFALVLVVSSAFAAGDETIVDIAVEDGRFDTLVAAVVYADLVEALSGGEWTVFAPTDDAFAKLGLDENNITSTFSKAELTDILLYHTLEGEVSSDKALTLLGDVTMANGEQAGLKAFAGDLYVNDDSKVIIPDVDASNGVIHVVDTVILGPWPRTAGEADLAVGGGGDAASGNTIVDIAVNNGSFDTLAAAVVYAGLDDALSTGEWTVFAPTDSAFADLGLNASNISSAFTKAEITDILLYHALEGEVNSDKALTLLGDVTMANGEQAGLKFFDGSLWVNDYAKVIAADVNADNGVIHVVDSVILGPWPAVAE